MRHSCSCSLFWFFPTLAFLADLGIEGEGDSEPEISELSDEDPPLPTSQPPGQIEPDQDNQESEWDSSHPSLTPRPGILKNWKQVREMGHADRSFILNNFMTISWYKCVIVIKHESFFHLTHTGKSRRGREHQKENHHTTVWCMWNTRFLFISKS